MKLYYFPFTAPAVLLMLAAAWMIISLPVRAAEPAAYGNGDNFSLQEIRPVENLSEKRPHETIMVTAMATETDRFDEFDEDESDIFDNFDEFEDQGRVFDPLGGYNRVMTTINDRLYYLVLKPAARGYNLIVAEPARKSISRFFTNLGFPVRFVNNLLQLKGERAATEVVRFVVNSSIGVLGLWDPASEIMELPLYDEDFGQTLGHYGVGQGFHIVLPLLGPSNLRDTCGMVADWPLNPVKYIDSGDKALDITNTSMTVSTVKTVNSTSLRLGQYETMTEDAVDLYIFLRESYTQNRNKQIRE